MSATPEQADRRPPTRYSARHPGYRALHAKGMLLKGTFTATPEAVAPDPGGAHAGRARAGHRPRLQRRRRSGRARLRARRPRDWRSSSTSPTTRGPTSSPRPRRGSRSARRRRSSSCCGRRSRGRRWRGRFRLFLARHPEALAELLPERACAAAGRPATRPAATTRSTPTASSTPMAASATSATRSQPEAGDQRISPREAKRRGPRLPPGGDPRAGGARPGSVHARAPDRRSGRRRQRPLRRRGPRSADA